MHANIYFAIRRGKYSMYLKHAKLKCCFLRIDPDNTARGTNTENIQT